MSHMHSMAVLAALILKSSDFLKYLWVLVTRSNERKEAGKSLLTQVLSSAAGVIAVVWFKHTSWAAGITVGTERIADLSPASTILFGVVATTLASTIYDLKKALDNTETASKPRLFGSVDAKRKAGIRTVLGPDAA